MKNTNSALSSFLKEAKTPYHAVGVIKERLLAEGYEELYESDSWSLCDGGKYFTVRGGASIIAFRNEGFGFMVTATHCDSPSFRVKGELEGRDYIRLDVEKYGGPINYSWLDTPLSVGGRIVVKTEGGVEARLADIGDKTVVIPSLAIHMRRDVNDGCKLNVASDMIPLASLRTSEIRLLDLIAESAGVDKCDIISYDLQLFSAAEPVLVGLSDEFLLSSRIDDLSCVWGCLEGFLSAQKAGSCPVLAVFDNEETGSHTKQGAASTFLRDTLMRVSGSEEEYNRRVASGFMVSADNAHAFHPNHPELADKENAPTLGGGIVIKYNANQKYTTEAVSDAIFREVCRMAGAEVQSFYNRADMVGGSTLGSISNTKVSLRTVDIGLPQLAMHSCTELMAMRDAELLVLAMKKFYSTDLEVKGESIKIKG